MATADDADIKDIFESFEQCLLDLGYSYECFMDYFIWKTGGYKEN